MVTVLLPIGALLGLIFGLFLIGVGIANAPWLILFVFGFLWLAWPRKRRRRDAR